MKIIDFHTHTFPAKLAHGAISSLEKSSGTRASLDGTNESLLSSMRKYGIAKSVLMPIAVKPGNSHTINTCAIENNKIAGFVSFGSVHPYEEGYIEELERIKKAGLKGVKLHPDFQGVFIDDPKMVAVMRAAADLGLLITIHSGMDVSFPKLHRSTPKRLASVLPELKGARIICAHSGGYRYNDDVLEYLTEHPEIYIDTSYSIGQPGMDTHKLIEIYKSFDPAHILFGTDSPWEDQQESVNKVMSLPIEEDLKEKIMYKNAETLLK
ncbi:MULTISPECIES: amidohydrolase family protein [unclassified Ruminococcus]|uniref:amidohydrolase family protein n=1 Tax=unclassified Ruminococcus TaxID=2608920 RepID=UPI00210D43DA|nr:MULTISPECIES: amidohydrolase family protein [unclassified Ruminococcus]MCQ4023039.1 amidohydrolase family protein [Ruminococcus sp. zg-924]MCQ4115476.1 amidohydrolase family protein [Ruminococcus sp. zg-921]